MFDEQLALLIGRQRLDASVRRSQTLRNPATGEAIGDLPLADISDLDDALAAAQNGFARWRRVSAYERAMVLRGAAALLRQRAEAIARRLTLEQGKALAESRIEVAGAIDTFEWYADEGRRAYGRIIPSRTPGQRWLVEKEPIGPVAAFSPWNFPAMLSARKIAGALAAGCSCIIKPAEETPSPVLAFAAALEEAGLPPGVLSVVFGDPAQVSAHLIASPVIRKISFTGSIAVGKHLAGLAAQGMKRGTYELGGHAPVLVFDDADLDEAVTTALSFKIRNAGQMCISPTRFYVQEGIYDRFVDRFTAAMEAVSVGDGMDEANRMGSMANPRRIDAMQRLVSDAVQQGARLRTGGERIGRSGYFWQPTVLSEVPNEALVMSEEPFGPVAVMNPFRSVDEAVEQANRLPYGLASYAFTQSSRTAAAVSAALETGVVGINNVVVSIAECPFGGVKESGYGAEAGLEGLDAFLNTKFISQS